ncbi:phosphoglycerate transporter protein [Streptococcus pseudoporcinus]|uniref:Phosphoglycerate transporter protein n=1 Tax=Streptococcus pseudoporcinus TaxID=361101 RepID=A0A4U9Z7A7_9STRE|nr:MFS transporter [Streptococcus pseudoporcinus]VTS35642.1 phosphoglycerate transporter protein [Streptococcus pseudoporcinus]
MNIYEKENAEKFSHFLKRQKVVFLIAFFGYVCAYLVRNNFKLMSHSIMISNGWDKAQIATLLSCLTVSYGLAKFYMGALGDRVSLRKLFATSLAASAIICIIIGFFHKSMLLLGILLFLCGVVQGALAPASQAMIANFFPNKTRGGAIAGWNISQNAGSALLPLTIAFFTSAGLVVPAKGNILLAFLIPGLFVLGFAAICWKYGGDNPESEGLDSLRTMFGEGGESNVATEEEKNTLSYWQLIWKYVFCNPALLLIAAVNVALYFVRFGIEDWMPIYLSEVAQLPEAKIHLAISILEWVAIPGSLLFAWLAVKYPNKMAKIGAIGLLAMSAFVFLYEHMTASGHPNYLFLLIISGILGSLIYGPQLIVNILTINFVPLNVAGTAIGFVGVTAYLIGNMGANWLMPIFADKFGWLWSYLVAAALSAFSAIGYLILSKREEELIKE